MVQVYENDAFLSLETIRDHLAIQQSNTSHDAQLQRLAQSAYSWATTFLNRQLHTLDDNSPADSPFVLPADLETALLLHIEAYFERDPQAMVMLLTAAENLAYQYRVCIGA